MFQLKEGIQTECQGPSQALEIKREVWSNGQDDSHMLQDESCSSYGQRFFVKESSLSTHLPQFKWASDRLGESFKTGGGSMVINNY